MGILITTILVLFILNSLFLIFLVMVQTGKNSGMGSILGGSSSTVFGASSADIMTKITRGTAISFIVFSLLLSFLFAKREEKIIPEGFIEPTIDSPASEMTNEPQE